MALEAENQADTGNIQCVQHLMSYPQYLQSCTVLAESLPYHWQSSTVLVNQKPWLPANHIKVNRSCNRDSEKQRFYLPGKYECCYIDVKQDEDHKHEDLDP